MYKWTNALYCINHEDNKSPHVTLLTVESHPAPGGRSRGLVKPPKYKNIGTQGVQELFFRKSRR